MAELEKAPSPVDADAERAPDAASLVSEQTAYALREGLKPAFLAKANVLNDAIAEIGMGRYQWELFVTGGFGWFADNIWLQGVAIIMPAVANEFTPYPHVRLATLALYAGLIVGAAFWGCSADIIGRRLAWNCTLLIGGIFGIAAGAANGFVVFCGNMPVDATLVLEFYLLTLLSLWWAVGQVVASLISWAFLAKYGCETPPAGTFCSKESNMGWRYTYYTLGAMMIFLWAVRYFALPVYESPKWLVSIGKDAEAVAVIHKIASKNGVACDLTVDDLRRAALPYLSAKEGSIASGASADDDARDAAAETKFTARERFKASLEQLNLAHIKALFATRRLAYSTSLIIFCYAALGLAYPLYNGFLTGYLATKNASFGDTSLSATYAGYTYQAACGVPGSMLAAALVDWSRGGRKLAMSLFTIAAGVFLFALTAARNGAQINALTSIASFFENAFYGVLYGYAPELFHTPSRGTGDALCSAASRVTGIFAPVIAVYSNAATNPNGPVFASASIFVATGLVMLLLPVETRGKTAL